MEIHQEKRTQYVCEHCDKPYATKFSLSRHVGTHSRPQITPEVIIKAKKTQIYHCEKCEYNTTTKRYLSRHCDKIFAKLDD